MRLSVDLDAIVANWRRLAALAPSAACAAVVKADAYGLGLCPVAAALARAGCRIFFVADTAEGRALREALADFPAEVEIYVLDGHVEGAEALYDQSALTPMLGTADAVARWARHGRDGGRRRAALMLDTGMARLGLGIDDVALLAREPARLDGIALSAVMSHLACADEPDNPMSRDQRQVFDMLRAQLPASPASLANSAGVFLGSDFHYDIVRPGAALYGLAVMRRRANPMAPAVLLEAKIVQFRHVDTDTAVGYGASRRISAGRGLATVAMGYADGLARALSNRGSGRIGDVPVPVVGRVSMDLVAFDVTGIAAERVRPGNTVEIIGPSHDADALAAEAGTIGYEVLARIGARVRRVYRGGGGDPQ